MDLQSWPPLAQTPVFGPHPALDVQAASIGTGGGCRSGESQRAPTSDRGKGRTCHQSNSFSMHATIGG